MIEVLIERTVAGDPEAVFAFLADHSNNPAWQSHRLAALLAERFG